MTDDDDIGFDLSAWEVPPAPSVADAVLARMRTPATAVEAAPPRRPWWIGGAVAAAAIAGVVVLAQRESAEPLTGSGAVAAARPSRIDLGNASSAALDGATDVHWVRDGHRVVAMQPRGTVTWQIADDDQLVIDAGATVAQVKASGASLRVEVAAAVTVVVYQGQVEVAGDGKTTTIAAGEVVKIGKTTVEPAVAGTVDPRKAEIERLEQEIARLEAVQKQLLQTAGVGGVPPVPKQPIVSAKVHDGKFKADECIKCHVGTGSALRRDATLQPALVHGPKGSFPLTGDHANLPCVACHKASKGKTTFTAIDRSCTSCHTTTAATPICDDKGLIASLEKRADDALAAGMYGKAMIDYERLLGCKPPLVMKAYLAACRAKMFPKAKAYFKQLPAQKQPQLAQICISMGIDPREP